MRRRRASALLTAVLVAGGLAVLPGEAVAGSFQSVTLQDDTAFGSTLDDDPAANMDLARDSGVNGIRIFFPWRNTLKPQYRHPAYTNCSTPPPGVRWDDPANYDFSNQATAINNAVARGLTVTIQLVGPFPCWASYEPGNCTDGISDHSQAQCWWKPRQDLYGGWVGAIAQAFPTMNRFSAWNEPNDPAYLGPQSTGDDPTAALMYRSLWFAARQSLLAHNISAPLFFGEVSSSERQGTHPVTPAATFMRNALCFTTVQSGDSRYPSCSDTPAVVRTPELSFHDYIGRDSRDPSAVNGFAVPETNRRLIQQQANVLAAARAHAPQLTEARWIVESEFGVHHAQCYGSVCDGGDPSGSQAVRETRQAAYLNCAEENAWKRTDLARFSQYVLQDPPQVTGDRFYTGLRRQAPTGAVGSPKPSLNAFQRPFTVLRKPDGRLEVWGAWRPNPRPPTLQVQAVRFDFSVAWERTVTLGQGGYFHAYLADAPGGFSWRTLGPGNLTSRIANGGDCGPGWTGGDY